jgi:hypothetical protein
LIDLQAGDFAATRGLKMVTRCILMPTLNVWAGLEDMPGFAHEAQHGFASGANRIGVAQCFG